ncbi:MAG: hypothetical protein BWY85_02343 [Firmicutes bacterium ADurb.Bin506]|nr:MAG: hypothetical protein BWY85_02343 [Firmicutes bacterium ADurb.Bin506]
MTTPTSGRATAARADISPIARMAISATATSCPISSLSRVKGRPISLFMLPSVASTDLPAPSTAAIISLVVVLPALPVTPTTLAGIVRLW